MRASARAAFAARNLCVRRSAHFARQTWPKSSFLWNTDHRTRLSGPRGGALNHSELQLGAPPTARTDQPTPVCALPAKSTDLPLASSSYV